MKGKRPDIQRNDRTSMLRDLQFGQRLLDYVTTRNIKQTDFFDGEGINRYIAADPDNNRGIERNHARTLMTLARCFGQLPQKNGVEGFGRLLRVLTVTEAKELTAVALTQEERLAAIEAIEDGKLSHKNSILRSFVKELKKSHNFASALKQYGNGAVRETQPASYVEPPVQEETPKQAEPVIEQKTLQPTEPIAQEGNHTSIQDYTALVQVFQNAVHLEHVLLFSADGIHQFAESIKKIIGEQ